MKKLFILNLLYLFTNIETSIAAHSSIPFDQCSKEYQEYYNLTKEEAQLTCCSGQHGQPYHLCYAVIINKQPVNMIQLTNGK